MNVFIEVWFKCLKLAPHGTVSKWRSHYMRDTGIRKIWTQNKIINTFKNVQNRIPARIWGSIQKMCVHIATRATFKTK